eukprot:574356-Rhodomonas_salina.2
MARNEETKRMKGGKDTREGMDTFCLYVEMELVFQRVRYAVPAECDLRAAVHSTRQPICRKGVEGERVKEREGMARDREGAERGRGKGEGQGDGEGERTREIETEGESKET